MIKAEAINRWIRSANACCNAHSCNDCPLVGKGDRGGYCRWEAGDMTQEQVDLIAAYARPVDWSKVPVDTKVIVWDNVEHKYRRHFAKYENGEIFTYMGGATSWSCEPDQMVRWQHGEIAQEDDE